MKSKNEFVEEQILFHRDTFALMLESPQGISPESEFDREKAFACLLKAQADMIEQLRSLSFEKHEVKQELSSDIFRFGQKTCASDRKVNALADTLYSQASNLDSAAKRIFRLVESIRANGDVTLATEAC